MKRYSSLGGIFIHPLIANDSDSCSNQRNSSANVVSYNRWNSLPNSPNTCIGEGTLRSGAVHYPRKISTDLSSLGFENQRKSFPKKVGFVDLTYIKYLNSFMGEAIVAPGSNMTSEENVRLTFEAESPFEKSYVMTQTDKEYCNYIDSRISGLMHVPFSTLIHAAPVLHSRTFGVLKGIAWEVLLSSDCELSQAAGAFFLLASVRESETGMNGFVKTNILNQASAERSNNAILKFKVLWDCRYGVWPRMEGRSQKKFIFGDKEDKEKKEQTIGYSQLANPLGHQGVDLPLSPSDPVSVCTSRVCADNPDKCYRPTKMAPVVHPKEISGKVHAFHVSGVSVPQEVGGTKSNSVVYKVDSDDVAGVREWEAVDPTLFPHSLLPLIKFLLSALIPANINPSPSSHDSSHNSSPSKHSANSPQLEGSELARQVVWTCMVEDPRLFFRSLLNRFNKLYMIISDKKQKRSNFEHLIADTLEPFHIVLQTFPKLPPRAAHMLLNNFVGVIMQHTDQPYSLSGKVIQSVLTLISMVTCSVQGLDSKLLKSYLKKESCYTSMMASARIRGVERVVLVTDHIHYERKTYRVTDDMTFGHLMDDACHIDQSTRTLLNNWYLLDESKDLPVLSTMFIQDHYSAPSDKTQHPTFILRKMTNPAENVWGNQMDQLFVFKMSEVMRVLFNTQLLLTGPEVEKGHAYSEYALPNYQFIHNELVELNSFPRKALTSVQYEAGPSALHFQLHASDIMLKGMWVRFVMQLMVAASRDYDWSNSMLLFMNVVNGSLLLHSEDHTILYYSLATILITVTKFNSVFKKDGYQMVVPALVNIYHLHMKNKIITNAIKFVWVKFYILNGNSFISQVMAAASTLLSEEAAFLSNNISSSLTTVPNRSSSNSIEAEEAKRLIAKALFELNGSLVDDKHRVKDELNILHCCFHHLDRDLYSLLTPDSLHYLSIKETALLAIVLASWNPEAIRGMQVLIFLEHMMSLFLLSLGSRERKFITDAMQYLIKKCESISKPTQIWRGGDILSSRINGAKKTDKRESVVKIQKRGQSFAEDDVTEPLRTPHPRKSSMARVMNKILYNPNRKEVHSVNIAEDDGANSASGKGGEGGRLGVGLELGQVDRATYQNQFRLRGLQNTDHKILQMSRNALLSIISECSGYYSKVGCMVGVGGPGGVFSPRKFSAQMIRKVSTLRACIEAYEPTTKLILDPNSVLVAVNIACQMLKQGTQSEVILQSKGLNRFFSHFLLSLDWTENHFSSFNALLHRLVRLFKQMQRDSSKAIMVWDHLTNFILGLTLCIHHNPQLVLGQDQILARLKALLETVMLMQGNRGDISALHKKLRSMHPSLLESAPSLFSDAVIELAVELIVITNSSQNSQRMQSKFRYHITDLILQKSLKDHEDFLMPKIILPLCIQLGLRADCYSISGDDVDFFMMFIDSKVDVSHKFKLSADIPELILRVLKVFCCAFSEALTLHQWNRVAQWIIALFNRKLSLPPSSMRTSTTSISNEVVGVKKMARKQSSILGSLSPLESFISFHENLLSFFETFLVVCRVPLLLLLQPLLWKMQPRLEAVKQGVKLDNPGHLEKLSGCIEHCQQLKKASQRICYFKGRQQLLQEMQEELKWISQNSGRVNRSYTTTVDNRQPKKSLRMRRNSEFLGKIKEEPDEMISSSSLPRVSSKKVMDKRPTTLSLSTRSASLSNPNDYKRVQCSSNKLKSSVSLINPILSSSIGEGIGMKKRSSEIRTRTRFMDSIENLEEEEEECFLVPAIGDSNGKERFSMHLSPQKRGRSPKLSRRGSEEDLSFEYMANVDEDLFKSDQLVIENSMSASPIRSPHSHGCVKEQNCLQENANATNLSLCPPKKKVAFKKRSGSRSPSPHFQTVRVEVHYSKEEENEDEMKESEWKELEEAIGDGSLRSMGSPLLQTMETEMSRSDDLDTRITSNTQFLFSSETSREYLKEKSNSVGSSSTKHALTKVLKRSKSPSYSAINKLSISQPCVASDDTNQLLDVCEGGNRNSAYHEWGGITSDDNGMLVKSHSVDHAQKLCVGSYSFGSHNVSSA